MLRKIRLYGALADLVGYRELEAKADTVGEAIRFLLCNWPQLEQHMAEQYYKVQIANWRVKLDEIHYPAGTEPIQIIPVVEGAGGKAGSLGTILVGAALIGIAVASMGTSLTFTGAGFAAAKTATATIKAVAIAGNIGIGLAITGVAGLLTPVPSLPSTDRDATKRNSFSFSGVQQTSQAGTAIPVVYGDIITGSVVVSSVTKITDEGATE